MALPARLLNVAVPQALTGRELPAWPSLINALLAPSGMVFSVPPIPPNALLELTGMVLPAKPSKASARQV
jgi:hypothetical protein